MSVTLGKPIPYFEIAATSNLVFSPDAAKGRQVVMYFYPKDMTPGCTIESMEFRDLIDEFTFIVSHQSLTDRISDLAPIGRYLCPADILNFQYLFGAPVSLSHG